MGKFSCLMLECVTNSSRPECVDYLLPESEIIEIIDGLCEQMPNMPGCTINKLCKGLQQPFCSKFSLLADICQFDMPNMKKCSKYKSLCSPDSVVKQCKTHASIPGLPTTRKSKEFVHDICTEMDMKGCDQCKDKNCESFAIYADLCRQMPGMSQCSSWNYMCNWDPNLPFCTVSSDPEWNSPQMKMYFHIGIRDYILFESWLPSTGLEYFMALCFSFCMAMFYEYLLSVAERMIESWKPRIMLIENPTMPEIVDYDTDSNGLLQQEPPVHANVVSDQRNKFQWSPLKMRCANALIRLVTVTCAYICMLLVMSYNVGIFLATVCGLAVGTFLWADPLARTLSVEKEHCC